MKDRNANEMATLFVLKGKESHGQGGDPMEGSAARAELKAAVGRGDYASVVRSAAVLAPGKERELDQFRTEMEFSQRAIHSAQWRSALRALAQARMAAVAAGVPELERISTDQMYLVIKLREEHDRKGQLGIGTTATAKTSAGGNRLSSAHSLHAIEREHDVSQ